MKNQSRSNQEKAPKCAKFVEAMREAFGAENVKVRYVKEGEFEIGEMENDSRTKESP